MSRIMRSLSSDMVIPFREWEPKNSSHNGWNSQGIRREGGYGRFLPLSTGSAAPSPHAAAKPLRPTAKGVAVWGRELKPLVPPPVDHIAHNHSPPRPIPTPRAR